MSDPPHTHDRSHVLHDGVHPRGLGRWDDPEDVRDAPPRAHHRGARLVLVPVDCWPQVTAGPFRFGDRVRRRIIGGSDAVGAIDGAPVPHTVLSPDRLDVGLAYVDPADPEPRPEADYRVLTAVSAGRVRVRAPGGSVSSERVVAATLARETHESS